MDYGTGTTGAENDIEQATAIARQMVTRWDMSDKLGLVRLAPRETRGARDPRSDRAAARAACGQRVDPAVVTNGVAASVP